MEDIQQNTWLHPQMTLAKNMLGVPHVATSRPNSMILEPLVNHGWEVKLTIVPGFTSLLLGVVIRGGIEIVTILALALFATLGLFPEAAAASGGAACDALVTTQKKSWT